MKFLRALIIIAGILTGFPGRLFSQLPQKSFDPQNISADYLLQLKQQFGKHKKIPVGYEKPILIALSYYPELAGTSIEFRIKKKHSIAETRSSWPGLFKSKADRDYIITISKETEAALSPLLMENVPFNAQIGLIGHELAHVADFSTYSRNDIFIHAIKNVSARYLDKFEFKTDSICIAHGLGYQLLSWSMTVRERMHTVNWRGPDHPNRPQNTERYMNPGTILMQIRKNVLYVDWHETQKDIPT